MMEILNSIDRRKSQQVQPINILEQIQGWINQQTENENILVLPLLSFTNLIDLIDVLEYDDYINLFNYLNEHGIFINNIGHALDNPVFRQFFRF